MPHPLKSRSLRHFLLAAFSGLLATTIYCGIVDWETIGGGLVCASFALPAPAVYCILQSMGVRGMLRNVGFLVCWILLTLFGYAMIRSPEGAGMGTFVVSTIALSLVTMHAVLLIIPERRLGIMDLAICRPRLVVRHNELNAPADRACRSCSNLLIALALSTVVPPVVINFMIGGGMLEAIARLLTGRGPQVAIDVLGPMLVTFLLPAIIAAILGVSLRLTTWTRVSRRCGVLVLSCVAFSLFMLAWPLLPLPWQAMGLSKAVKSRLESFSWSALYGLFLMEGWAVVPHALVIVAIWCKSLLYAWRITGEKKGTSL